MGGTIAVVLRRTNGTVIPMRRWTNPMPDFVHSIGFIKKNKPHIDKWMKQWIEMKEDWDANKGTGKFKQFMTDMYAPYPAPLAPCGYGLIVLDQRENTILSYQNYCSFGQLYLHVHNLDKLKYYSGKASNPPANHDAYNENWDQDLFYDMTRLFQWYNRGKLAGLKMIHRTKTDSLDDYYIVEGDIRRWTRVPDGANYAIVNEEKTVTLVELGINTWDELIEFYGKCNIFLNRDDEDLSLDLANTFVLDMSPFIIRNFKEGKSGAGDLKQAVLDLGFVLSAEDEKGWDEWTAEEST